jgi:hypothetical protein
MGLGEKERARVEAGGRVDLTAAEAATLSRSKTLHIVLVPVFLVSIVRFFPIIASSWFGLVGLFSVPATFVVPGVLEAVWAVRLPAGTRSMRCRLGCLRGCQTFGKWLAGFVCFGAIFGLALNAASGGGENFEVAKTAFGE